MVMFENRHICVVQPSNWDESELYTPNREDVQTHYVNTGMFRYHMSAGFVKWWGPLLFIIIVVANLDCLSLPFFDHPSPRSILQEPIVVNDLNHTWVSFDSSRSYIGVIGAVYEICRYMHIPSSHDRQICEYLITNLTVETVPQYMRDHLNCKEKAQGENVICITTLRSLGGGTKWKTSSRWYIHNGRRLSFKYMHR